MNYYNEHDPKAAAWLRELIAQGSIPAGVVDERDIQDVKPTDLSGYVQCHFFAGIVGWPLALRLAGWPDNKPVWTGSCPCQPFSCAGKGLGTADERHLWPDFRNLIGECRPPIVFGEQVASKDGRGWLAGVSADLEAASYRFAAANLCAAGVGSPQKRQRLYWVADNQSEGRPGVESECSEGFKQRSRLRSGGAVDAVDNSTGARLKSEGKWAESETRDEARLRGPECGCSIGGVVSAESHRLKRKSIRSNGKPPNRIEETSSNRVALGDTKQPGLQGQPRNGNNRNQPRWIIQKPHRPTPKTSAWDNSRTIQTSDGKTRRIPVEPAFFPLVDGFPARVAVLKCFGNAICPQLAAEFIQAYIETQNH